MKKEDLIMKIYLFYVSVIFQIKNKNLNFLSRSKPNEWITSKNEFI